MSGVRLDVDLGVPPERAWRALTDRDQLISWLMETDFSAEVGHRFMLWPGTLPGFDGPISAVVLELIPQRKLVMGWQSPHTQTTMTWSLQPTRDGCRLRVTETGHVGELAGVRERTLQRLFAESLPAVAAVAAPAAAGAVAPSSAVLPVLVGFEATGASHPVAEPATPRDPVPPPAPRRRGVSWATLAALLLVVAVGIWLLNSGPRVADQPDTAPGQGGLGPAPGSQTVPTASIRPQVGSTAGLPPATAGPGAPTPADGAHLTATYQIVNQGALGQTVRVGVHNPSPVAGRWRAVSVHISVLGLIVESQDRRVIHQPHGLVHCFYSTPSVAVVAAGSVFEFTFTVTGVATVDGPAVDPPACP